MQQTALYWFRQDLRLHDNVALNLASKACEKLVLVYCHSEEQNTKWGWSRCDSLRKQFIFSCLDDLRQQLKSKSSDLVELHGNVIQQLSELANQYDAKTIYCELIEAPEELAQVKALEDLGFTVRSIWQSSMVSLEDLPFQLHQLPDVFTQFRVLIEKNRVQPRAPQALAHQFPTLPANFVPIQNRPSIVTRQAHPNSSFPFQIWKHSGESQALKHLDQYFSGTQAHRYKETRNQLTGWDYSTKFSVWLACGALSPRTLYQALKQFESTHGQSDGSYWIWFELLWRDYFRFLHFKYGKQLYHATGLLEQSPKKIDHQAVYKWRLSETGQPLIDAAMNELNQTGFLSNRLRQIVASFLIYNLKGDWRAGASWFESQLLDYDVYSNQGNWLYIAGYGTDPRGGRAFDLQKQTKLYDPNAEYRKLWAFPTD